MTKPETVWEFNTARFRVTLEIAPEDMDPADSFECSEDIEDIRNDLVAWFWARTVVYLRNEDGTETEIGSDSLGGCAYRTVREFFTEHRCADPMNRNSSIMRAERGENVGICHYFPDMVSSAIADARKHLCAIPRLRHA